MMKDTKFEHHLLLGARDSLERNDKLNELLPNRHLSLLIIVYYGSKYKLQGGLKSRKSSLYKLMKFRIQQRY